MVQFDSDGPKFNWGKIPRMRRNDKQNNVPVISNPSAALRINSLRDLSEMNHELIPLDLDGKSAYGSNSDGRMPSVVCVTRALGFRTSRGLARGDDARQTHLGETNLLLIRSF